MSESSFAIVSSTRASKAAGWATIALLAALASAPYWGSLQTLHMLADISGYIALATMWNLLAGFSGLVSVGQQAYVGLGGYLLFALTMFAHVPPLAAIPIAGVLAGLLSVPIAALLFRLRGAYFAIGSWVVAEVLRLLASLVVPLGAGSGISLPISIVLSISHSRQLRESIVYWSALFLLVVVMAATIVLLRSRWGLALRAISQNELAARSHGVEVGTTKLVVYAVCAIGTAMFGALIFLEQLRISPDAAFSLNDWTAYVIFITVIGGIGRIEGPIIGALIFFAMRETLSDLGSLYLIMLGALAIAVMIFAPRGIWGFVHERFGIDLAPLTRRLIYHRPPKNTR